MDPVRTGEAYSKPKETNRRAEKKIKWRLSLKSLGKTGWPFKMRFTPLKETCPCSMKRKAQRHRTPEAFQAPSVREIEERKERIVMISDWTET
jgi:hypothetical protein